MTMTGVLDQITWGRDYLTAEEAEQIKRFAERLASGTPARERPRVTNRVRICERLYDGAYDVVALHHYLPTISAAILSVTLTRLQADGTITLQNGFYALTDQGHDWIRRYSAL